MHEQSNQLERVLRRAPVAGQNYGTLSWGGRSYAIAEVTNIQAAQKGQIILLKFEVSDGLNHFEVQLTNQKAI